MKFSPLKFFKKEPDGGFASGCCLDEIPLAKSAKEFTIASNGKKSLSRDRIKMFCILIQDAIDDGKFSITINNCLDAYEKDEFKKKGYIINIIHNPQSTIISWK